MTTRTMYDSTRPSLIPADAQMVAGYATGRYRWTADDWARFPRAAHVRIDVTGGLPFGSDVADVERGDLTSRGAVEWVRQRQARGWWSCCYVDRSDLDALRAAMGDLDCEYWVADWTGTYQAHDLGPRVCAVQYASTPSYDLSVVFSDEWFPTPQEDAK